MRTDNRIENLRLLCYHCHGETDTWCGKNKSGGRRQTVKSEGLGPSSKDDNLDASSTLAARTQCACGKSKTPKAEVCWECETARRSDRMLGLNEKIAWPSDDELLQMVETTSFLATGAQLGVSDNAVRKRLRNRGLLN